MEKVKGEMAICLMCMEAMGKKCTLSDVKEKHQNAVKELEEHIANRKPYEPSEKLIDLSIRVDVCKSCIKTREKLLGIGLGAG